MLYGPPLRQPINPNTILCAFDLHSVLFHRDWRGILNYLIRMPRKLSLLCFVFNPFFWISIWRIWNKTSVGDEIYEKLVEKYPALQKFQSDFIALENMQNPDNGVLEILRTLKAHGYHLYILSNIGERAFIELAKKFPDLLHLFDHLYLPQKSNNYRQKPHKGFYEDFKAFVDKKGDGGKSMVFIDDRIKNVDAAVRVGISAIHFRTADRLKDELKRLSILI
jgi:FMN phosphatase YigB (HAD superfamily)